MASFHDPASLRKVSRFFELMGIGKDPMKYHLDCWGAKKLFSVGIRRWGVRLGARQARVLLNLC